MIKRRLFHLAAAVICVFHANAERLSVPPDAKSKIDKIFTAFDHTDRPGCSAAAEIDGAPVLNVAYGMADLEHSLANTPDTIFEAGSVSKQFTAAAVLLLEQQGKLSLDDPVRKYIPELPEYKTPVTIRHMLNHTSGLRDWGNIAGIAGWPRTTRAHTHAHVLDIVSHQRELNYPAGAEYSYSNTGYNLAAIIVSRVSGKSFSDFTRDSIFAPLGMNSTQWRDDFRRIVRGRAVAYTERDGTIRTEMPFEDVHGNGGLLTTVGDLLRWNQNFTNIKMGGQAFVESQQQRARLTNGRTIGYAAGLMILSFRGLREVSHSGSTAGYRAWLGRYPDQGLSVALLCNSGSANPTQLGHQIAAVYLSGVAKPPAAGGAAVDPSALQSRAGMYRSLRDNEPLMLEFTGGALRLGRRGALQPVSATVFALGGEGGAVEFDDGGRMRIVNGIDQEAYQKIEPAVPSQADMEAMTGEYKSDEAEVTIRVTLDQGRLVIHRRPDTKIPLTPSYRDAFTSTLGAVRFLRGANGKFNELSIGEQRVWDIRFQRVPGS